ncbi:hypothetical protein IGI04_035702 [Brassica rapa subsp. trilocularis]|uniref:Uncharacterized protein n=1 Tax=Brassica rapa subsp. trilocularis TaxID=1813537 RepID=A0ABQ7LCB2_BRACM|nr:hypothetical protein IGI04_035702 [Brassica rapa subsp. trilocularis]
MEGSSYLMFSISSEGSLVPGTVLRFLLAGTWSVPLAGTRESGSCLEAGGNDTRASLRQDPVPLVLLAWVPLKPELILTQVGEVFVRDIPWIFGARTLQTGEMVRGNPYGPRILVRSFDGKRGSSPTFVSRFVFTCGPSSRRVYSVSRVFQFYPSDFFQSGPALSQAK